VLLTLGSFGIVVGAATAIAGAWFPARKVQCESWGGVLFICGLAFVGLAVPMM